MIEDASQSNYERVYAIVRVDLFHGTDTSPENKITVKKIVRTPEHAAQEVDRLNNLKSANKSIYFWQVTRMERE